jgi:tryptophan synthase beta chain
MSRVSASRTVYAFVGALNRIKFKKNEVVVLNLSGRGDKDMATYMKFMNA